MTYYSIWEGKHCRLERWEMTCRHIRTQQERRRAVADLELVREYPMLKVRAGRNHHNLPSYYDEIMIGPIPRRSWKFHRKTQYHPR